jgi:predicted nucleic acid-binding protein
MSILLDTNVISELVKDTPDANVLAFVSQTLSAWIPAITVHELEFGIARLPKGRKRAVLETKIAHALNRYRDRILPVTRREALESALMRAEACGQGRVLHLPDALIAATAKEHGLTLATRNLCDFVYLGIDVVDPWSA